MSTRAPSATSMSCIFATWRNHAVKSSSDMSPSARMIAVLMSPPAKIDIRPLGGSARHNLHRAGRSDSSWVLSAKTRVSTKRVSIHSLSRLTISLAAIRSSPAIQMMTGKSFSFSSYCACTSCARRSGTAALYSSLPILLPTSATSSMSHSLVLFRWSVSNNHPARRGERRVNTNGTSRAVGSRLHFRPPNHPARRPRP